MKKKGKIYASIFIWLLIWQLCSHAVANPFLMAGPFETARALLVMIVTPEFRHASLASFFRIFGGFLAGSTFSILCAAAAYRSKGLRIFLSPFVACVKAVPVASFIILILIWAGNRYVAFWVSAIICFPVLYLNTLNGLMGTDCKLLETANLFHFRVGDRIKALYLPQLRPFLKSGFSIACGMSFKAGIAAEVIGQPLMSIGNAIYCSKIYLETADIFAWTATVVFLSRMAEKMVDFVVNRI